MNEILKNINLLLNIEPNILTILFISTIAILLTIKASTNFFENSFIGFFIFSLPGTIAHELMHFLIGLILFAKPVNFSIIPHRGKNNSFTMGSVSFTNVNAINAIPISLAPLLLIPISFYYFYEIISYLNDISQISLLDYLYSILFGISIISFISSSIPSSQDIKVALSSKTGLLIYTFIIILILNINKIEVNI
jgi:hypothetical protein